MGQEQKQKGEKAMEFNEQKEEAETENEMNEEIYARYHCPICGAVMARDASVFLSHAKQHILELMRKTYPDRPGRKDGFCDAGGFPYFFV